ncbi:hypothetical protein PG984_005172, partial [Apiospora sp. TS-2023a]
MASFGQLTNAFFRASQETSIGLANVNFDFSVIKYDAPREYQGLGEALSKRRRETAEDGPVHITARKLGALFQSAWPKVPSLTQAYGLRSSEIAKLPEVNPQGSVHQGLFADHVGADGTTIWAAATSGERPLACTCSLAVSIWSELVDARKALLEEQIAASESTYNVSDLTASRIEISRDQLDAWDGSARAWLQCADTAKALQQTQLRLLVDNITLPISPHKSLYSTVMDTAIKALQALDWLVRGVPQQIDNGAVLLGLSSWHLYPDILMASTNTHIKQADNLIASGGIITIGLENKDGKFGGVFWSLPLAQAKYYGDPFIAKRCLGVEQSRVSFDELQLVIIGRIMGDWEEPSLGTEKLMEFIQRLSIAVGRSQGTPM